MNRRDFLGSLLAAACASVARFYPAPEAPKPLRADHCHEAWERYNGVPVVKDWRFQARVDNIIRDALQPVPWRYADPVVVPDDAPREFKLRAAEYNINRPIIVDPDWLARQTP